MNGAAIKPAPIITLPATVPETRVILRTVGLCFIDYPRIVVRRGRGAGHSVRIYRRTWD